jgi:hypothetical protein
MNGTKIRSTRALLVGATGQMGQKIVRELVALGRADVRVTHRAGAGSEAVDALRQTGAELVVADLADESSLARACHGVDVIVSAVQGLRDVVVDGQTHLLRAAENEGVADAPVGLRARLLPHRARHEPQPRPAPRIRCRARSVAEGATQRPQRSSPQFAPSSATCAMYFATSSVRVNS